MLGGVNTERYRLDFLHLYSPAFVSVSLEEENHSRQRRFLLHMSKKWPETKCGLNRKKPWGT